MGAGRREPGKPRRGVIGVVALTAGTGQLPWSTVPSQGRAPLYAPADDVPKNVAETISWRSKVVMVVLVGGVCLIMLRHSPVYRDTYRTREDCERDWGHLATAERCYSHNNGGTWVWRGPSYEQGARPITRDASLRIGTDEVQRGGFGRSSARFSVSS